MTAAKHLLEYFIVNGSARTACGLYATGSLVASFKVDYSLKLTKTPRLVTCGRCKRMDFFIKATVRADQRRRR
jgi:hypothetical protein